jgi:hypothetical protein
MPKLEAKSQPYFFDITLKFSALQIDGVILLGL